MDWKETEFFCTKLLLSQEIFSSFTFPLKPFKYTLYNQQRQRGEKFCFGNNCFHSDPDSAFLPLKVVTFVLLMFQIQEVISGQFLSQVYFDTQTVHPLTQTKFTRA